MSKLDRLYFHAPLWLQNAMVSTYGIYWHWLRFGGSYKAHLQTYQQHEYLTYLQWQEFQDDLLRRLLFKCATSVPYYRNTWTIAEKAAANSGDLFSLPLLEKAPIRNDPHQFCREDMHPFPKLVFHTSGTTGTPIQSIWTISEQRNSLALREARSANWAGVSFSQPRATFSGRLVEPDPEELEHIYRYNAVEKQVYFSAFHLGPKTAKYYIQALKKHKIVWMTGYAVSFFILAKYILDQKLSIPPLKAIVTTSEKLTPEMRTVMQKAYQCRVYEEYSTVENALFASECEYGNLHVSPDVGKVEILDHKGEQCQPDQVGEVVTTCLMRNYQPLIRFRLGDLAAWDSKPCPCGRSMPVIKEVLGRIEDVVIGADGRQMVRFHGIFVSQPHVVEGQIIQESLNSITARVVPTEDFNQDDVIDIRHRIVQRLGSGIQVRVETVPRIARTKAGKFKAVISNLTNPY